MKAGITNKIIVFSYLLFALSLLILYLNKAAAIIVLAVSFGIFLLGGFLHILIIRKPSTSRLKKEKEGVRFG